MGSGRLAPADTGEDGSDRNAPWGALAYPAGFV